MAEGQPGRSSRIATVVVSVAAVVVCVMLARWQWERAHRSAADAVPDGEVVALADLDPTIAFSGMRVALTGRFDVGHTVLVGPRRFDGAEGAWVLTPLVPDGGGAAVGVVRGWIPAGTTPAPAPRGTVQVLTVLVADQQRSLPSSEGALKPEGGMIPAVDTGVLASAAGYPVRSGWFAVVSSGLEPSGGPVGAEPAAPIPLQVADLPGADLGMNWRNAAYALQWLVFAGFVVLFARALTRQANVEPTQETTR